MRHVATVERWSLMGGSGGPGPLHRLDARVKLAIVLAFLISLGTSPVTGITQFAMFALLLLLAIGLSGLPSIEIVSRAAIVLPFTIIFAALEWSQGNSASATALLIKSYLSGLAVLIWIATTPFPEWLGALEKFRMPRMLLVVVQFLYRYLFVIPNQAGRMMQAAQCRRGQASARRLGLGLAGSLGVLFVRSWERADSIYACALSRGFTGTFVPAQRRLTSAGTLSRERNIAVAVLAIAACVSIRVLA